MRFTYFIPQTQRDNRTSHISVIVLYLKITAGIFLPKSLFDKITRLCSSSRSLFSNSHLFQHYFICNKRQGLITKYSKQLLFSIGYFLEQPFAEGVSKMLTYLILVYIRTNHVFQTFLTIVVLYYSNMTPRHLSISVQIKFCLSSLS